MDYLAKIEQLKSEQPKTHCDWLNAWRDVAQTTYGISVDDPRYESVMRWLDVCDAAFTIDSWSAFQEAAAQVKAIAKKAK
jgi:hypothetical protein